EGGGEAEADTVGAGRRILGGFEAHQFPVAQRRGDSGGGARSAFPMKLGAQHPRRGRLICPLKRNGHTENTCGGPLDVRAQRRRRGVDVENATCGHRTSWTLYRGSSSPTASYVPSRRP